jgi:hypothetical protein
MIYIRFILNKGLKPLKMRNLDIITPISLINLQIYKRYRCKMVRFIQDLSLL